MDKRTAITYIDSYGNWYRATKGAPEQVSSILQKLSLWLFNHMEAGTYDRTFWGELYTILFPNVEDMNNFK